jgi:hypothetical protein
MDIVDAGPEPSLAPVAVDGGSLPPTGEYDVIARIVADDCATKEPVPQRMKLLVLGRAYSDGRIGANMPMPEGARSDVGIEPRRPVTGKLHPDRACPGYTIERTVEITAATHDMIRLLRTDTKGDPSVCGKPGTACATKTEFTYGLVKELCAAGCNPKMGPGVSVVDCICTKK